MTRGVADTGLSLRLALPSELRELVRIDDAASELYAEAGLEIALAADHPFVTAEVARWSRAIERGLAHVAASETGELVGFMALDVVDDAPYLDQIAVLPRFMRRGVGSALMQRAFAWAGPRALWLTTYSHLPWNRPYYERHGFALAPEAQCGPELQRILDAQRAALPDPAMRVAMVRRGTG
jgi:GNAT superfamily N-acetyltransferase